MLLIGIAAADGGLVERDGDQPGPLLRFARHPPSASRYRFRRIATDRACPSSPSERPSAIAAGPSARRAFASHFRIEVRFMKSSTPRPDEKRAERAVGRTWFGPPT